MYKTIFIFIMLFLANNSSADELSNVINVGVINIRDGAEVMSVTKSSLINDNVLLCSKLERKCYHLSGDKFSRTKPDENASDVAGGKEITSYIYNGDDLDRVTDKFSQVIIYPAEMEKNLQARFLKPNDEMSIILNNVHVDVRMCSSPEGLHIYSPQFKSAMHIYYSLGYDVNPTCNESVYQ